MMGGFDKASEDGMKDLGLCGSEKGKLKQGVRGHKSPAG